MKLRKLSVKETQSLLLYLLKRVDNVCSRNQLTYYLVGGTLLGAIRHGGFIPWDNDIDICLPRKDYEKLIANLSEGENKTILKKPFTRENPLPFAKLSLKNTLVEDQFSNSKSNEMIWIDIFPIDGAFDNDSLNQLLLLLSGCLRKVLLLKSAKATEGSTLYKRVVKLPFKLLSSLIPYSFLYFCYKKIINLKLIENSNKVYNLVWGLYGRGEIIIKKDFLKKEMVSFEGDNYPAFSCYKSYLTGIYGNYMELPPIEQRISHRIKTYVIDEE